MKKTRVLTKLHELGDIPDGAENYVLVTPILR
jgi:hypothetical protein